MSDELAEASIGIDRFSEYSKLLVGDELNEIFWFTLTTSTTSVTVAAE